MTASSNHKLTYRGFTLVELLIVIVVIAILATISVVTYRGVQQRAQNVKSHAHLMQWRDIFALYNATYGAYPPSPQDDNYCLGSGFPKGPDGNPRCRNYDMDTGNATYLESDNAALMSELSKVASVDSFKEASTAGGWLAGPYVVYEYAGPGNTNPEPYKIVQVFQGKSSADCPSNTTFEYTYSDDNVLMCSVRVNN